MSCSSALSHRLVSTMTDARNTSVSPMETRNDIGRTRHRYGADGFAYYPRQHLVGTGYRLGIVLLNTWC